MGARGKPGRVRTGGQQVPQSCCSTAELRALIGGAGWHRTTDLRTKCPVLSLSYNPKARGERIALPTSALHRDAARRSAPELPAQKRQRRHEPSHLLSGRGPKPNRHERARVRCVRLDHADVRYVAASEMVCDPAQFGLVARREHHRVRPARQVPRAALPRCVCDLRGQKAQRQVASDYDVVAEGRAVSRVTVAAFTYR